MKRILALLLLAAMFCLFCGCESGEQAESAFSGATDFTEPITVPTTVPETKSVSTPTEEPESESPEAAFDDYTFRYEDQRNLDWERDVVYFARLYLGEHVVDGHPVLTSRNVSIINLDNVVTQQNFYDAALRDIFIQEVHGLLDRIPELTDVQITYGLARIVAILGDAHSCVYPDYVELFPFVVEQMEKDGHLGLYAVRIPGKYEDLIFSELIAINGIPVEAVVQRLMPYISTENEYWAMAKISGVFHDLRIADKDALQAAGIVGPEEDTAVFSFRKENGAVSDVTLEALDLDTGEYWNIHYAEQTPNAIGMLSYSQYGACNYFFEYLSEFNTIYIRLYNISQVAEYRLEDLLQDVQDAMIGLDIQKIVVDVRDNPGGYLDFADDVIEFLEEVNVQKVCILMNGGSFSGATVFPNRAREKLDNVTLIGTPAAQAPRFFAGASSYTLRKHDVYFTISGTYFGDAMEFEGDALMPDVLVYQSLDDYMYGVDTILLAALKQ